MPASAEFCKVIVSKDSVGFAQFSRANEDGKAICRSDSFGQGVERDDVEATRSNSL